MPSRSCLSAVLIHNAIFSTLSIAKCPVIFKVVISDLKKSITVPTAMLAEWKCALHKSVTWRKLSSGMREQDQDRQNFNMESRNWYIYLS